MKNDLFFANNKIELEAKPLSKETRVMQGKGVKKISLTPEEFTSSIRQEKQIVCDAIKQEVKKLIDGKDFKLCNHEYANGYCYGLQYDLAKILEQIEKGETE